MSGEQFSMTGRCLSAFVVKQCPDAAKKRRTIWCKSVKPFGLLVACQQLYGSDNRIAMVRHMDVSLPATSSRSEFGALVGTE